MRLRLGHSPYFLALASIINNHVHPNIYVYHDVAYVYSYLMLHMCIAT